MEHRFYIQEDIRRASTIPARCYRDPSFFEWTRERVFARSWQLIADYDGVTEPERAHPFTFLEGCIDEPLLLTRDQDGALHCLSNVCTHRGNLVVEEPGTASGLRCRYHGRRFDLDGTFRHMPEFEETCDFPTHRDDLPSVPFGSWEKLVFAAIDPAFALEQLIGEMRHRVGWLPIGSLRHDPNRSRDYLVSANWALYCDNYLEGFHIPFVHEGLHRELDYARYRTELHRYSSVQIGIAEGEEYVFDPPESSPDHGQPVAGYYFWLFPNLMFNFYPWGLSVNIVTPLAVDRTKVSFLSYVWDDTKLDRGAGGALDRVEHEDEAIVELVQKGIRSRFYDRGRYSPTREQGVHHFHRLLAEFANDDGP